MKQFLSNALTALVTGIFFCLGLVLVGLAIDHWLSDEPARPELQYTHFPTDLRVKDVVQVMGMPELVIRGAVDNIGTTTWQQVAVEAPIKVAGTLMNRCETDIFGPFPPGTTRRFQIRCYNVAGANLPVGTSYNVVVTTAGSER
jgi:hypothetical protein